MNKELIKRGAKDTSWFTRIWYVFIVAINVWILFDPDSHAPTRVVAVVFILIVLFGTLPYLNSLGRSAFVRDELLSQGWVIGTYNGLTYAAKELSFYTDWAKAENTVRNRLK